LLLVLIATAISLAAAAVLLTAAWLVASAVRRRSSFPFLRAHLVNLLLLPLHALVVVPLGLGWIGAHWIGTRPDERGYDGPSLQAGRWQLQARGGLLPRAGAEAVDLVAADGVRLRGFFVEAKEPCGVRALLVHGLFRGGLELEPPASLLHELGCDVFLLELRNHGGSGKARASFGLRESRDVAAAARWLESRPDAGQHRVLVLAVSLGTIAVAHALQDLPRLDALVLDAPVADPWQTALRMLGAGRRVTLPQPFCWLALHATALWGGFSFAEVAPLPRWAAMPKVPVLVVAGAEDDRVPLADVRAVFAALPAAEPTKELWVVEGAGHGDAWLAHRERYRERLAALLARVGR
jgi:pimeloyl-ACP methyl ester carboxylesterase